MREDNYEDIIHLEHYEPKNHSRMSNYKRAAQFAPFAALTGYEEQIIEVARLTNKKIEIDDGLKEILSCKLNKLNEIIQNEPYAEITYFMSDDRKDGGKYVTETGTIKRIDIVNRFIKFSNSKKIIIDNIINIKSDELDI